MGSGATHPPEAEKGPGKEGAGGEKVWVCDLCGTSMLDRHCKLVCQGCGYVRDCSDP